MPPGKLVARQWMGQEVVGWRDDTGRICVANAFCPHLGAKLAPETGGTVRDGRLVCPFHGFTYDTTGACVATPSGSPRFHPDDADAHPGGTGRVSGGRAVR